MWKLQLSLSLSPYHFLLTIASHCFYPNPNPNPTCQVENWFVVKILSVAIETEVCVVI